MRKATCRYPGKTACGCNLYGFQQITAPITVVSATLSQNTSGKVSSDDAALAAYQQAEGTTALGAIIGNGTLNGCYIGNEVVGAIAPSTYTGTVTLNRFILNYTEYTNITQTGSGSDEPDPSEPALTDDNPQSGGSAGKIYDLDAPGKDSLPVDTNTYRLRGNFYAYATLPDGTRISPYYPYYVRVSCKRTASGYQFDNTLPGDNQIQSGTTLLTWNFQ